MTREFEQLLAEMRPFLGRRVSTLRTAYTLGSPETRRALEAWLQLHAERLVGKRVGESPALLAPPEPGSVDGPFVLGTVMYHDREMYPVGIDERALMAHMGVFGRTGTGKTNFCLSLLKQLKQKGVPFLIFDWKRNYRDLLADMDDLRVFTVGRSVVPFSFQPLIPPQGTTPSIWLKLLIDVIANAYYVGEGVKFLLMKAIDSVYREMGVYDGKPKVWPSFRDVLLWLEGYKPSNARESQWMISTLRAVQSLCYGEMGRVVNKPQQTPVAELLQHNVVLELDALTQTDKTFLTEALLLWLHRFRMQEGGRETLKHVIVIEEAHHVLKETLAKNETIMEVTLREVRELGEGIILIDQTPSQISPTALANTATKLFLNLPHRADISTAAAALLLQDEQKDILGKLPVGVAVMKLQDRHFMPFLVKIPLVRIQKGKVTDDQLVSRFPGLNFESGPEPTHTEAYTPSETPKIEPAGPAENARNLDSGAEEPGSERFRARPIYSAGFDTIPARRRPNTLIPRADKEGVEISTEANSAAGAIGSHQETAAGADADLTLSKEASGLLQDILSHPFDSGVNARYGRLKISTRRGQATKKQLEQAGLIESHDVALPHGKLTVLQLTLRGRRMARRLGLGPLPPRQTGPVHEFWRRQTIAALQKQGYRVENEVRIPGNGLVDLCATRGQERLAIEIETGRSDTKENIRKALHDGFTGVIVVAVTPEAERKVQTIVESLPGNQRAALRLWTGKDVYAVEA